MSAKPKPKPKPEEAERDPLIITVSESEAMTQEAREEFRAKGGTVTNDPQ